MPRHKREDHYEAVVEEERLILDATELVFELMEVEEVNQTELAARLDKTKGFVSQLLNGKRNMTLRTFADLLRVLGYRARFQVSKLSEPIVPSQAPRNIYLLNEEWTGVGKYWGLTRERLLEDRPRQEHGANAFFMTLTSAMRTPAVTGRGPTVLWDVPDFPKCREHEPVNAEEANEPATGSFAAVS
jgi:transcriptional regulator with XRE-family HTH domain